MYYYLKDFCALILSSVTLYNGLTKNDGTVAIYGKGDFAHSLYKLENLSRDDVESMLRKDANVPIKMMKYPKGPIYVAVCVSNEVGTEGLEEFLIRRGFRASNHENEDVAAKIYFKESKSFLSRISNLVQLSPNNDPFMGLKISSALTIGRMRLIGRYGCVSSNHNKSLPPLPMNSPLDMGIIKPISTVEEVRSMKRSLVYINSDLRFISTNGKIKWPMKKMIWDIYPRFDDSKIQKIMRKALDTFMYMHYKQKGIRDLNSTPEDVLLGCYKDTWNDF